MLEGARRGRSSSLLVEGEAGIGKTCLCDYAFTAAEGFGAVRARGVEAECLVPFSGLQQLLHPLRDKLDLLPSTQRRALGGVLAVADPSPAPALALGAATLTLLASGAEDGPLLVIADDVHWFDAASAQATSFAARRLDSEGVALLATRRPDRGMPFDLEHRITLTGLDGDDAAGVVRDATGVDPAGAVLEALVTATG